MANLEVYRYGLKVQNVQQEVVLLKEEQIKMAIAITLKSYGEFMDIDLSISDINFLHKNIFDAKIILKLENAKLSGGVLVKNKYSTGKFRVNISKKEQDIVISALTDALVTIGIDENDEPNDVGIYIEELIDKFNKPRHSLQK